MTRMKIVFAAALALAMDVPAQTTTTIPRPTVTTPSQIRLKQIGDASTLERVFTCPMLLNWLRNEGRQAITGDALFIEASVGDEGHFELSSSPVKLAPVGGALAEGFNGWAAQQLLFVAGGTSPVQKAVAFGFGASTTGLAAYYAPQDGTPMMITQALECRASLYAYHVSGAFRHPARKSSLPFTYSFTVRWPLW